MKMKTKTQSIMPLSNEEYSLKINYTLLQRYRHHLDTFTKARRLELEASIGWLFFTDDIKKKTREHYQKILKTNDLSMMIMAFIGLITNIISSSIYLKSQKESRIQTGKLI